MIRISEKITTEQEKLIDQARYVEQNWAKFASEYANLAYTNLTQMSPLTNYQPSVGEGITRQINISKIIPSQADLTAWLESPATYSKQLRKVSQYLEGSINQYKRTIDHFSAILLFKNRLSGLDVPKNKKEEVAWDNGYKRCLDWLRKFNLQYQFKAIVDKSLLEGGIFTYLREGRDFNTLIEIPSDYCYITGKWDLGFTYAIDLGWFDIIIGMEKTCPEIYEYYKVFVEARKSGLKGNDLIHYQFYPVPIDKGFVFTFDSYRAELIPPFTGIFKDALAILEYKNLLKQKTQLETWKMVSHIIPRKKDDSLVAEAKSAGQIIAAIQSVMPAGTIAYSSPFEPKELNFNNAQSANNLAGLGESLFYRSAGINGAILDASEKTAVAVTGSLRSDFGFVDHLYRQCENFVNLQLLLASRQMKFKISLYGNRYTEIEDRNAYMEACVRQNFPVSPLFGWFDIQPYEIDGTLYMEKKLKLKDNLEPIKSAFNTKDIGGESSKGAPAKSDGEIKESGSKTKDYDSNKTSGKVTTK